VEPPSGPLNAAGIMQIIRDLGFLQIDTVRNVVRAQDHILWSRNRNYRERMLWPLLQQRHLFEHFTHDASLIPVETYPLWQRQFRRLGERAAKAAWYRSGMDQGEIKALRDRIAAEGPLSTHAFDSTAESREMWARKPHKKALEQMWYAGVLATSMRRNFVKYYDLGERVFRRCRRAHRMRMLPVGRCANWRCSDCGWRAPARSENSGRRCRQPRWRHGPAARTWCRCASRAPTANGRRHWRCPISRRGLPPSCH
jgi:uncharacterized protein YcaQ